MKKRIVVLIFVTLIFLTVYVNKFLELQYNVNISEYIHYQSDYTAQERKILKNYSPLIYGGNINEPPLGIYYEKYNQYTGIVVDYINALSIELGVEIMSQPMIWDQALEELKSGKTNLCDMIPSQSRSRYYLFSNPLYTLRGIITVKNADSTLLQIDDLKGKKVAVQSGDIILDPIRKINGVKIVETNNVEEALELLKHNKVDAVGGDEPVIRYYLNELSNVHDYRILESPLYESSCSLAVPKNQAELIPILNKAIFHMKEKGILNNIESKWAGPYTGFMNQDSEIQKQRLIITLIIFMAAVIGYLVYLWNRSLKVLVDSRTKELSFMKNELEITFNGIKDFMVIIGSQYVIKNVNESFLEYLKMSRGTVVDKPANQFSILKEFEEKHNNQIQRILNSDHQQLQTYNPQTKLELKYERRIFEFSIYPLPIETKTQSSVLVMISDITLSKIEAQKLIQSNKMETIGQLAAGVAHELKNPLGIIRNSIYILREDYDKKDRYKTMALDGIDHSVTRASNIIDNLLRYSKLTGENKEWVNLSHTIQIMLELNSKQIKEQHILVRVCCEQSKQIYMNRASLEHILLNLIKNALDAMPEKGELSIVCSEENDQVIIQIKDTGSGIDEGVLERIFDPFYTTKPLGEGTGLGLYIVYSELESLHGKIWVESEKNNGTTFNVSIPKEGWQIWQED